MFNLRSIAACLAGLFLIAACGSAAETINRAAVLAPFVNDDTVAVAYVDVGTAKASGTAGELLKLLPKGTDTKPIMLGAMLADGMIHRFQEAGGESVYVVAALGDIRVGGGPIGIATTRPDGHPEEVEQLFRDLIREVSGLLGQGAGTDHNTPANAFRKGLAIQFDVQRKGNAVLIGPKSSVARYLELKASPRTDLVEPLAKLVDGGGKVAGVFCPGSDYRRVSRELWPELPGALAPLRGEMADRWLRFELDIKPPGARLSLVAKDAKAAEVFAKLWRDLPTATTQFGGNEKSVEQAKGYAQLLIDAIPVKVEGTTATLELPANPDQIAKLLSMFGEAADKSMESSRRSARMTQFKQLALAMQNFYSSQKHFPPAAITDKEGKPLLSWRVAVLPFIDENELYKQFHLDEPWDSPHNKSLIKKMPELFADPDGKQRQLAQQGKTTYMVPIGPETIFFNNEGTKLPEITDGTSRTIMIVEVDPEHAVEWTKPVDWEVDLKNPTQGLTRADRDYTTAAFADGSVRIISPTKEGRERLKAELTRAGGEVIK